MSEQLHTVIASDGGDGRWYVKCTRNGHRVWTDDVESAVRRLDDLCSEDSPDFREHYIERDS